LNEAVKLLFFVTRLNLHCATARGFLQSLCIILVLSTISVFFGGCPASIKEDPALPNPPKDVVASIGYTITHRYHHDPTLFTEGLLFHNGSLYESTGSPPEIPFLKSMIVVHDLEKGTFSPKIEIDRNKYFGEGIAICKNKILQLTYRTQVGFIYDAKTFRQTHEFNFQNAEGWGATSDGTNFIISDGTSSLTYIDPEKLTPIKTLLITENGMPRDSVNELEYVNGYIYANVWMSSRIIKIDAVTGKVVGAIDVRDL
jgi:glutamine cyclotransferase